MSWSDAVALKNSDLNAFLFADVGVGSNGCELTILSVLARLGQDPWEEAARLSELPNSRAVDCLVQSISKMPLDPLAFAGISATVARVMLLLPAQGRTRVQSIAEATDAPTPGQWAIMIVCCVTLVVSLATSLTQGSVTASVAPLPKSETAETK